MCGRLRARVDRLYNKKKNERTSLKFMSHLRTKMRKQAPEE